MARSALLMKCYITNLFIALKNTYGEFATRDELVEDLKKFGEVAEEQLFILDNEHNEEYNSYTNLFRHLNRKYNFEDSFSVGIGVFSEGKCNVGLNELETSDEIDEEKNKRKVLSANKFYWLPYDGC